MKTHLLLLLLLLFILGAGCHQSTGPCEYDIIDVQAEVVAIEPFKKEEYPAGKNTQLYHIFMRFNESKLSGENQSLEELVLRCRNKIDSTFIKRNKIKTGDIYTGTVSERKSGDCQPLYVSFNNYFKTE